MENTDQEMEITEPIDDGRQAPEDGTLTPGDGQVITDDEIKNLDKVYYTIGEVSKMFNANTSLIRYWEKEFPSIKPKKNGRGNRMFTKKDIETIKKIHFLVKDRGMTLEGAKKHLKTHTPEDGVANFEVIKLLQNLKKMVLELKDALETGKDGEQA